MEAISLDDINSALPIFERAEDIAKALEENQVIVIAGETGSGKTTQLPKICLAAGRGQQALIGHTQPRRLAARSVASRIAEELNSPLGERVGYQVRFTDKVTESTQIKLMTDGILLAEIQQDPMLSHYDTLIIDEAHERSLNIDFLLGYLKQLLNKRPDLKLIVTSATIDIEKFSKHFDQAPVIQVSGRTYPVEVRYRPLLETGSESQVDAIMQAVDELSTEPGLGDILVFLSGEKEIRETALRLRREQLAHLEVVPLYARLSAKEQNKIFQSHKGRRVVLSTNVAETSLTVPGIRYVIDPGYARISRYSFRSKIQRLPVEAISQASADQRKGRCGRVSEGICIRLYSEDDYLSRPEFTEPEILRTNLAAVILQMAQLRLGDIHHFPFVDKPDNRLIKDGYQLLNELRAINLKGNLTRLGRRLAALPLDPKLGAMLLAADQRACLQEVIIIVSALSIQDPRDRPTEKQQAADQCHREYWHESSDFLAFLSLWQAYEEQRQSLSRNQLQRWCQKRFLSPNRMREWREIHTQIAQSVQRLGLKLNQEPGDYENIHRSLVMGLLGNVGLNAQEPTREYIGARNRRFNVFPGSSQFKKNHRWILAAQLLETSKVYGHTTAKIEPDWVLEAAKHLVKYHYSEPHYHAKSGQVMAFQKVTLYGLILVEKQRVGYGKIDPAQYRETFIRAALVEGKYAEHNRIKGLLSKQPEQHFFLRQQRLIDELETLEAKSRRRDILVDEQVLFDFYHSKVPENIVNLDGFEHWRKQIEQQQPDFLYISREQLMQHQALHISEAQFPDSLRFENITFPVSYHFDPNHQDDGVTIEVPVQALHQLKPYQLEWLVPGLLKEKCVALVKSLPKQWRKNFVPVPETIDKVLNLLKHYQQPLAEALSTALLKVSGTKLPDEVWQNISIDPYYQMNIHVLDMAGKLIDQGRDLVQLRERYRDQVQTHLQTAGHSIEREGLQHWDFGALPESVQVNQQGLTIKAYPALVDKGDSVAIELLDSAQEALVVSLRGMVRLVLINQPQMTSYLKKGLLKNRALALSMVNMGNTQEVLDDLMCAAVRQTCFSKPLHEADALPRTQQAFEHCIAQGKGEVIPRTEQLAEYLLTALDRLVAIKKQLKQSKNPLALAYAAADIDKQFAGLFYPGCIYEAGFEAVKNYPRFLQAIEMRLSKVPSQVQKDRLAIDEIQGFWDRYQQKINRDGAIQIQLNPALNEYRWMIEEWRVSLFAQTLGTKVPVSSKRLNKQWSLIE